MEFADVLRYLQNAWRFVPFRVVMKGGEVYEVPTREAVFILDECALVGTTLARADYALIERVEALHERKPPPT